MQEFICFESFTSKPRIFTHLLKNPTWNPVAIKHFQKIPRKNPRFLGPVRRLLSSYPAVSHRHGPWRIFAEDALPGFRPNLGSAAMKGWPGAQVFAISPACRWRRRIADNRRTLQPERTDKMTRDEPKESILRRYLEDAIAAEENSEARLNDMSGEGDHMATRLLFAQHAEQTRSQLERLRARLQALGGSPSGLKSALAHLSTLIPKSARLRHDESEVSTQNLILGYAAEYAEVGMYEALASVAASAGDLQTEQLAREIQKEERHAAEMMWHLIANSAKESYGKISLAA